MTSIMQIVSPEQNTNLLISNLKKTLPITDKKNRKKLSELIKCDSHDEALYLISEIYSKTTTSLHDKDNLSGLLHLFLSKGYFRAAFFIRQLICDVLLKNISKLNAHDTISAISVAIEKNDVEIFNKSIPSLEKIINKKQINNIKFFFSLLSGENNYDLIMDELEKNIYHDFISDKNIALVTPTPASDFAGREIDSFDRVVKINFTNTEEINHKTKGKRCDISYYNVGKIIDEINLTGLHSPPNNLQFACYKGNVKTSNKVKSRAFLRFDYALLYGTPNMIPNALFDILSFNPESVKIFHSDLMINKKRVHGYYNTDRSHHLSDIQNNNNAFIKSTLGHDPFAAHIQLSLLFKNNRKVNVDQKLEDIILLETSDYAALLENSYKQHN